MSWEPSWFHVAEEAIIKKRQIDWKYVVRYVIYPFYPFRGFDNFLGGAKDGFPRVTSHDVNGPTKPPIYHKLNFNPDEEKPAECILQPRPEACQRRKGSYTKFFGILHPSRTPVNQSTKTCAVGGIGSISTALSGPAFVPPRKPGKERRLTFPSQRLVTEPTAGKDGLGWVSRFLMPDTNKTNIPWNAMFPRKGSQLGRNWSS